MGAIIAVVNKKGENATDTAVAMLKILKHEDVEAFGIASPTIVKIENSIEALQNQNVNSSVVVGHAFSKILPLDKPQPVKLENATLVFEGRIYPTQTEISDAEAVAKKLPHNHEKNIKTIIKEVEGEFAFASAESQRLVAGRDTMGIRPLYYGENTDYAVLASERKAFWRIELKR